MARRRLACSADPVGTEQFIPASGTVSQNDSADGTQGEEERQVRATLAEYFAILQEWSRDRPPNGDRSDSGI